MKNEFGLDVSYFRTKLSRVLESVSNYKPDEMARELARLVVVADEKVLAEREFLAARPSTQERGKVVEMRRLAASERHTNTAETRYWCDQYKQAALRLASDLDAVTAERDALERVAEARLASITNIAALYGEQKDKLAAKEQEVAALRDECERLREALAHARGWAPMGSQCKRIIDEALATDKEQTK